MFDYKLMLINSTSDVTDSVTGTAVDFRGEDHKDIHYRIIIPEMAANTNATVKIQDSDDGNTWSDLITPAAYSAVTDVVLHARSLKRYRRATVTKGGTGTFDCGKILIGVVPAGTYRKW